MYKSDDQDHGMGNVTVNLLTHLLGLVSVSVNNSAHWHPCTRWSLPPVPQEESRFGDSLGPLFTMYLKMAGDNKRVER